METASGGSMNSKKLQFAGVIILGVLTLLFVFLNRRELPAAISAARQANMVVLAVAAVFGVSILLNLAAFYGATYRAMGLSAPFLVMLRLTMASHFLNMVAKSGGMSGVTVYLQDASRRGLPRGHVVTAYLMRSVLGHLAFVPLLAVALVVVWFQGRLTLPEIIAAVIFGVSMLVYAGVIIAGARSRSAVRFAHALPARLMHRVARVFGRGAEQKQADHRAADELYAVITVLFQRPRALLLPVAYAFLLDVQGVVTIWAVLRAFHQPVGVAVPLVAYGISNLFAFVGVLPAGIGFVEASLGAVFLSYGIAGPTAAAAVLAYRLFEIWIPFLLGAYAAQSVARQGGGVRPAPRISGASLPPR